MEEETEVEPGLFEIHEFLFEPMITDEFLAWLVISWETYDAPTHK